jgi:hypothetical protein
MRFYVFAALLALFDELLPCDMPLDYPGFLLLLGQ